MKDKIIVPVILLMILMMTACASKAAGISDSAGILVEDNDISIEAGAGQLIYYDDQVMIFDGMPDEEIVNELNKLYAVGEDAVPSIQAFGYSEKYNLVDERETVVEILLSSGKYYTHAEAGEAVYVLEEGKVIFAEFATDTKDGHHSGDGKCVVVQDANGRYWAYEHLSSFNTGEGDYVNPGDIIGYAGSTGRTPGNCIEIMLRD